MFVFVGWAMLAGIVACVDPDGGAGGDGDDDPVPACGNHSCEAGESTMSCPADCPPSGPQCGNHVCETGETAATCALDCAVCGNNVCESGETSSCPADCPASLQVTNNSSYPIYYLYVRPCASSDWGTDQLRQDVIPTNGTFTLNRIPPGCYYLRALISDNQHGWQTYPTSVTLHPAEVFPWSLPWASAN